MNEAEIKDGVPLLVGSSRSGTRIHFTQPPVEPHLDHLLFFLRWSPVARDPSSP
jgi:hypothetical protein